MKKIFLFLTLFSISSQLISQELTDDTILPAETVENSNWKNWVFAGSALITAAVGVVIISLNTGTTSH